MQLFVYAVTLLAFLFSALPAFAQAGAGPQGLYFPGPSGIGGGSEIFTNLRAGPGSISITGGSMNGSDQISGVNVNGVINVSSYGAVGDGVTDDITAINNAMAACGNYMIVTGISGRRYAVSHPIHVPTRCEARDFHFVQIAGTWTTLECAATTACGVIQQTTANQNSTILRNIVIDGMGTQANNDSCVLMSQLPTGLVIDGVTANNCDKDGILVDSSQHFSIRNNRINNSQTNAIGVDNDFSSSTDFTIVNNEVNGVASPSPSEDGIFVALTPIPTGAASVVRGSSRFLIANNTVRNAPDVGIEVGGVGNQGVQNTQFAVTGNTVVADTVTTNTGIFLRNAGNATVTGNTIVNTGRVGNDQTGAIAIGALEGYVSDVSIVGNTMTGMVSGSGIYFGEGSDLAGNAYTALRIVMADNTITFPFTYTSPGGGGGISVGLFGNADPPGYDITITGNVVNGYLSQGIGAVGRTYAQPLWGVTVTGNSVRAGATTRNPVGIYLAQCAQCTATGNNVMDNGGTTGTGIALGNDNNALVNGNNMVNNTTNYTNVGGNTFNYTTDVVSMGLAVGPPAGTGNTTMVIDGTGTMYPAASPFASLGTPINGAMRYCTDCTIANPCAAGGGGAIAKRLGGAWVCN